MSSPDTFRILIVDDMEPIHKSIHRVLEGSDAAPADDDFDDLEADLFGDDDGAEVTQLSVAGPRFEIDDAYQGREGLAMVQQSVASGRRYAMAFVDMRMPPGWDGLETTQRLWEADPQLQVAICTAYSDRSWAEIRQTLGQSDQLLILKKPFDPAEVSQMATALCHKWRTEAAERELLEKTMGGAVDVMAEMLTLVLPSAASRVAAVKACVAHMTKHLGLGHWAYDLAAGLSQIGCIALPSETYERHLASQELDSTDAGMVAKHPKMGAGFIRRVPRLELVAKIVAKQLSPPDWPRKGLEVTDSSVVATGARLLYVASKVDAGYRSGKTRDEVLATLSDQPPAMVEALRSYVPPKIRGGTVRAIGVADAKPGMVLQEPVRAKTGLVVCPENTRLTSSLCERLKNFKKRMGIREPFRALVPAALERKQAG
jgi:CheY-like chemotaxis protein